MDSRTWTARTFRGTGSIQTKMSNNDDVIILRLPDFGKTLYFTFRKDYVAKMLTTGLPADTN